MITSLSFERVPRSTLTGQRSTPADQIHLWLFDMDDLQPSVASLSPGESRRADRLTAERTRHRFINARSVTREVLASYLGTDPHQLRFTYGAHGKPMTEGIQFNLTHSGSVALLAVNPILQLGIDLDHIDRPQRRDAIARRRFSREEQDWLNTQTEREKAFMWIWTAKEAYVKALGRGLGHGFRSFTCRLDGDVDDPGQSETWHLRTLESPPGTTACLVHPRRHPTPSLTGFQIA